MHVNMETKRIYGKLRSSSRLLVSLSWHHWNPGLRANTANGHFLVTAQRVNTNESEGVCDLRVCVSVCETERGKQF